MGCFNGLVVKFVICELTFMAHSSLDSKRRIITISVNLFIEYLP